MKIEIFTLCESAIIEKGSLSIHNIFDTINHTQIPFKCKPFSIAIRIRFRKSEEGNKKLRISFMDADGKAVLKPLEQNFLFQAATNVATAINRHLIIQTVQFHRFGEYEIHLSIDDELIGSIPLYVINSP